MPRKQLFTIVHPYSNPDRDFSITINHPVWITDDILAAKRETKRVLLEMVDTYPKLILAYSGGTDSAFILCCIRDLINEKKISKDTIEIAQGVFTGDGIRLTMDTKRATSFARKLGFSPRIHEFDINERWLDIQQYYYDFCLSGPTSITDIGQTLWASDQDGHVVRTYGFTGPSSSFPALGNNYEDKCRVSLNNVIWDLPNNQVNVSTWDNKIFSSFLTPFSLNAVPVDMSPFIEAKKYQSTSPTNSQFREDGLKLVEKYLYKWIIYFNCYPELMEVLGKFSTWDWTVWHHHSDKFMKGEFMEKFITETQMAERRYADIKLPDGRNFTKKDLVNYEKYC
tara:strand:- start:1350 stop:2366 length:1017 start_codon:yes stop_codon:yes gene_type:complete